MKKKNTHNHELLVKGLKMFTYLTLGTYYAMRFSNELQETINAAKIKKQSKK